MDRSSDKRIQAILVLVCLLVGMNLVWIHRALGWGAALTGIVLGFVISMVAFVVTTPLD